MILTGILNIILAVFLNFGGLPAIINTDAVMINLKPDAPLAPWNDEIARRGAVLAADDRFFLFTRRPDEPQPIASITKLMTALVFIDNNPGWDEVYEIRFEDKIEGGRLNLFLGEQVTVRDLFYTSLIASDNGATIALVHSTGLGEEEFVLQMNAKAQALGLAHTTFSDPIGLSATNVSTAREVAWLAQAAFAVPEIRQATVNREFSFNTLNGREKKIESTDDLLFVASPGAPEILGGKTGYTDEAGYCYVGYMKGLDGRTVISVVLGASGRNDRFRASRDLADWALNYFDWAGRPLRSAGR